MARKSHAKNTVGPWARRKLEGLESYLKAYKIALKNQRFRLVYIDAFAGAGKSKLRTAWPNADESDLSLFDDEAISSREQFIEGSPRRALNLDSPFDDYYFFDMDRDRVALLEELKNEFPDRKINVEVGDGNQLVQSLIPDLDGLYTRGVVFLDPYGPHLEWETLKMLGRTGHFEAMINFPLGMAINRLIKRDGDIPKRWRQLLDGCFGTPEWEEVAYQESEVLDLFEGSRDEKIKVDDAAKNLLGLYVRQLKDVFAHVATPSAVRNTKGLPLYYMIWAGPEKVGFTIADHILRKGEKIELPRY